MSARVAADVASSLPMDHPLAQVARLRLDAHVRAERKTMKIESPVAGYTGQSCGVEFTDGVGVTDDQAAINYFRSAGYTVDGERQALEEEPATDAREVAVQRIGMPLRDAREVHP